MKIIIEIDVAAIAKARGEHINLHGEVPEFISIPVQTGQLFGAALELGLGAKSAFTDSPNASMEHFNVPQGKITSDLALYK